jgi:hypothetical protein
MTSFLPLAAVQAASATVAKAEATATTVILDPTHPTRLAQHQL